MNKKKSISYAKWGYVFILPFFVSFLIFTFSPLVDTIRYSFYEYYRSGLKEIGPTFIGMKNYASLIQSDMLMYGKNTLILWIVGFIPQIVIALVLASWFADARLKLRGEQFFKVVIYLPNLIMAAAFARLFFTLFSTSGPINQILLNLGLIKEHIDLKSKNYGMAGALSVYLFIVSGILCFITYRITNDDDPDGSKKAAKKKAKEARKAKRANK